MADSQNKPAETLKMNQLSWTVEVDIYHHNALSVTGVSIDTAYPQKRQITSHFRWPKA